MSLLMDDDRVGETIGITAMGNEGAQWIGMAPFVETDHIFQNYGDGTFFHSAQLALQYCIGAGMNITFKILYNGTVAMTGGQDSTAPVAVPELATILLAHGVSKVAVTAEDIGRYDDVTLPDGVDVHDRTDIVAVQTDLAATPGVTVLIHDQFCAAELRRARKRGKLEMPTRRVVINHRICEGCGDCGDVSNCLSVQPIDTPLGRKTTIDQASCNFDESCLHGDCPAFMTVEVEPDRVHDGGRVPSGTVPDPQFDTTTDLVRIRMAGIGGTGVVTVAQILSTAAMFDGWEVRGLDQTGLSQKAGPVISDVVLAHDHHGSSNLVGDGQAELILAFDAMVAAGDGAIAAADPDRTAVVASLAETPTGRMISHPDIPYPTTSIEQRLVTASRTHGFVDAVRLSATLTGNEAQANVLLLGVAVQAGHVPVSVGSIEAAIELNGVAVEANLAAFDWGRRWAHDPTVVDALVPATTGPEAVVTVPELPTDLARRIDGLTDHQDLREVIGLLAADLVGYQDRAYAHRFLDAVNDAASHERRVAPDSFRLTQTVARSLHKLMAYKDEYEVARLLLLPEGVAAAQRVGGAGAEVAWQLHPPLLKVLGMDSKMSIGTWAKPAFAALRRGKRLRGTRLDPFGRTEMRRIEAALPGEFLDTMATVYASLAPDRLDGAVLIAGLPDGIRGYEDLKLRRVGEYRARVRDELATYRA